MSYKEYAMNEFKACGWLNDDGTFKDEMQKSICDGILDIMEVFSKQGHTANYTINLLLPLLKFEPLTPLTGEDSEWIAIPGGGSITYQNKRCSRIFKDAEGKAFDGEAVVFYDVLEDGDKSYFTSSDSHKYIEFPYVPVTEYKERVKTESMSTE